MDEGRQKPQVMLTPSISYWAEGFDVPSLGVARVVHALADAEVRKAGAYADLLYAVLLETSWQGVTSAFEHGAKKYAPRDWEKFGSSPAEAIDIYLAAAKRHMLSVLSGDDVDAESGLRHLAHVGACALLLVWLEEQVGKSEVQI